MRGWFLLIGAIVCEVAATLSLRASVDNAAWVGLVIVGYVLAFALLGLTLRTGFPIGVAYGIWGAVGVALVALFGVFLFDEALGWPAITGIALIIGGVGLIETGSRPTETPAAPLQEETP